MKRVHLQTKLCLDFGGFFNPAQHTTAQCSIPRAKKSRERERGTVRDKQRDEIFRVQYVAVGPSCLLLASHSVRFQLAKKKQIEKKSVSFQSSAVGSTDAVPVPVVGLTASRKGQHTQTHALVYACTHAHARATHQKQQAAQQQQPLSTTLRVFFWSHSNPQNHTHTTAKPLSEQVSDTHTHTRRGP